MRSKTNNGRIFTTFDFYSYLKEEKKELNVEPNTLHVMFVRTKKKKRNKILIFDLVKRVKYYCDDGLGTKIALQSCQCDYRVL